jgi:EAL domain-containing protein (putative c-di-GMP-specific phosphodiesterase class I)
MNSSRSAVSQSATQSADAATGFWHGVQLYESEPFLTRSASEFLSTGAARGEASILVCTPGHWESLEREMNQQGFDIHEATRCGRFLMCTVDEQLALFMREGKPDLELFRQWFSCILLRVRPAGSSYRIRLFTEMVAVLWQREQRDAALQIVSFSEQVGRTTEISVLSPYPTQLCETPEQETHFLAMCAGHKEVWPSETYALATEEERRRLVAWMLREVHCRSGSASPIRAQRGMTPAESRGASMLTQLSAALRNGEFRLHYQPQFTVGENRAVRFEALMRWFPEDGMPMHPGSFIPSAERLGLMPEVGKWVLLKACQDASHWQQTDRRGLGVAVNVSPLQLMDLEFVRTVAKALAETGLPAHLLELEITETALVTDWSRIGKVLADLRGLGVTLAMDDFGAGYASFGSLRRLPLDALKIDRSLVTAANTTTGVALLRCIVEMAHALSLRTVAEGVETLEQLECLRQVGCDEVQGFLLGSPVATADALSIAS